MTPSADILHRLWLPLAQWHEADPDFYERVPLGPSGPNFVITPGTIIIGVILWVLHGVIFGIWAKTRAEVNDANPVAGFIAGFLFGYIGVRCAHWLRHDRIFYTPSPKKPEIGSFKHWRQQVRAQQAMQQPPQPIEDQPRPQGRGEYREPAPGPYPPGLPAGAESALPEPRVADSNRFESVEGSTFQTAQPPAPAAAPQLDAFGFAVCPGCGGRVKQGRKRCGNCGANL